MPMSFAPGIENIVNSSLAATKVPEEYKVHV